MTPAEGAAAARSGISWFRIFKYIIYILLMINLFYYLWEDLIAFQYLDPGAALGKVVEAFAVTIDYVAWMVLILLFELETDIIPEEKLEGSLKWVFSGLLATCYVVLVYAFYGYAAILAGYYQFDAFAPEKVCSLVEESYGYVTMESRFIPLTPENCGAFSEGEVFKHREDSLIATAAPLEAAVKLGWIDVVNAGVWLLVVLFIELEVMLKLKKVLTKPRLVTLKVTKGVLYLILLANAIYWNIHGAFIDYWDAYLWLLAFVLIDLNIFEWGKKPPRQEGRSSPLLLRHG